MARKTYITASSDETQKLGEEIGRSLKRGRVLALSGELGSGKTTFVKGLAKGLGVKNRVVSPTFIIQNRHFLKNGLILYHFDLYRLDNIDISTKEAIMESLIDPKGISVIEWAEKFEFLPKNVINVKFEYLEGSKRRVTVNV